MNCLGEGRKRSIGSRRVRRAAPLGLFIAVGLIAGAIVTVATPSGATLTAALSGPRWTVLPSPSPPGPPSGELDAVACPSPTSCIAVGSGAAGVQAEQFDGVSWTVMTVASPSGASEIFMNGVACSSTTSCFAVGYYVPDSSSTFSPKPLIERWDGLTWSILPSLSPSGARDAGLFSVSCPSASSCFAVGAFTASTGDFRPMIQRWNGTSWSIAVVPKPSNAIDSQLIGVSCLSATSCVAVGGASGFSGATPLVETWNGTSWSIVAAPNPGAGSSSILFSVSCPSATSCFAVGGSDSGTLIERWNGSTWSLVDSPIPHGTTDSRLNAVSCAGPTDCWAVGGVFTAPTDPNANAVFATLAEHWNGTGWSVVPGPSGAPLSELFAVACPTSTSCAAVGDAAFGEQWNGASWSVAAFGTPTSQSRLEAVSCLSRSDCYAVGSSTTTASTHPLVEHWNGSSWSVVLPPVPKGALASELLGVACTSSTNCTAVGRYSTATADKTLVEHWNGTSWKIVPSPSPVVAFASALISVACPTASNCTAVGFTFLPSGARTLVEHWNGISWTWVPSPKPADAFIVELLSVSCPTTTDCTAVGGFISGQTFSFETIIEHWNGTGWKIVPSPAVAGDALLIGVSCASTTNCNAVGQSATGATSKTLAEHWNGTSWTVVPSPTPSGARDAALVSVTCRSAISCYAVGRSSSSSSDKTLVEHWDGGSWTIAPSANQADASHSALSGVSCPTWTMCIAVGSYAARAGVFTLTEFGR